jgi:hypothetical protein
MNTEKLICAYSATVVFGMIMIRARLLVHGQGKSAVSVGRFSISMLHHPHFYPTRIDVSLGRMAKYQERDRYST